jgi:cytochrome c oxidase assembly protein subunit 11
MTDVALEEKNSRLVRKLLLLAFGMFGFGYALVPIYNVFCDITGLNGKTNSTAVQEMVYEVDENREITVEFITSLNKSTPMEFRAETKKIRINPGKYYTVNFVAKNNTDKQLVARAIPSVTPGLAAEFFEKIECFCFSEQRFEAGEEKHMPVRFVVNPELHEKYKTITLAYTFFDITDNSVTLH